MSLKDTAVTESLAELHATYAPMNIGTVERGYCRLSSRKGLLKTAELRFVQNNGCPVCGQGVHENSSAHADQALFKRSLDAKLANEAAAQVPTPKPADPGPTIRLGGDAARFANDSPIARELADEAQRINERLYGPSAGA